MGTSKLGHMLVEDGLLSETDRRTIKRTCGTGGSAFARGILAMGLLDEDELAAYIAEHTSWHVASKNLLESVQSGAWGYIDRPLVEQLEVLPLRLAGESLQVAMVDPLDQDTISQLEFFSGYKILPVIATLTQVRRGLQKFLPDYKPLNSQLEDFLKNHSITASKRIRMADHSIYDDLPAPGSFSVGSDNEEDEFSDDEQELSDDIEIEDDDGDHIEFESEDLADSSEMLDTAGGDSEDEESFELDESSAVDDDNLFSIEDDSFSTSTDVEPTVEINAGATDLESAELDGADLGDVDLEIEADVDLDGELDFDLDAGLSTPAAENASKKPAVANAAQGAADSGDDLESLMALEDFDPDNPDMEVKAEAGDDLLAGAGDDLLEPDSASDDLLTAGGDDLLDFDSGDNLLSADSGDLLSTTSGDSLTGGNLNDLSDLDELSADFSNTSVSESASDDDLLDELDATVDADASAELSADFSTLEETEDALSLDELSPSEPVTAGSLHTVVEESEDSGELDLTSFDVTDDLEGITSTELSSDLGTDDELSFDEASESAGILDDDLDIASVSESAVDLASEISEVSVKPISPTTQNVSSMINKMFFNVSMASETKEAIGTIAPDLKATGFSTGLVIGGSQETDFKAECGWLDASDEKSQMATSASLQDKGIKAALGRLPSAWTPLDDAVRQGDLKVFASLQRDDKRLFGIKFSNKLAKTDTVIVTAMAAEICDNSDLMDMAKDLFRQVAQKGKGAA